MEQIGSARETGKPIKRKLEPRISPLASSTKSTTILSFLLDISKYKHLEKYGLRR